MGWSVAVSNGGRINRDRDHSEMSKGLELNSYMLVEIHVRSGRCHRYSKGADRGNESDEEQLLFAMLAVSTLN